MGKRREGFLTNWQLNYIMGNIRVSPERAKVEDHYILNSWNTLLKQIPFFESWLIKKSEIRVTEPEAARKQFFSLRGKRPTKYYSFEKTMLCPICDMPHKQNFIVQKDKLELGRGATMGVDRNFLKKIWNVEVPRDESLKWVQEQIQKKRFASLTEAIDYALWELVKKEKTGD